MAESKRKSKMISLRLSSAEYEALRAIHGSFGARSVSEFARQAMQKVIAGGVPRTAVELAQLDGKVDTLDRQVTKLVKVFETQVGTPKSGKL
jgi:hypothetical protein